MRRPDLVVTHIGRSIKKNKVYHNSETEGNKSSFCYYRLRQLILDLNFFFREVRYTNTVSTLQASCMMRQHYITHNNKFC